MFRPFGVLLFITLCVCVCVCVCLRAGWVGEERAVGFGECMCVLGNGSWRSDTKAQKVSVLLLSHVPDNRKYTNYVLQLLRDQNIHN